MKAAVCVILFLAAIVAANLSVSRWGQAALPFTAFVLIPFDMTTRDLLHDLWRRTGGLWGNMAALIAMGALLTLLLNPAASGVAVASCLAFTAGSVADASVYHLMRRRGRWARMNTSNAASAVIDSIIFPLVALATVNPLLSLSQAGSKFIGGLIWSSIFVATVREETP